MTIFEKYPEISKGRLTAMVGRASRLYDDGKTAEQIAKEIRQPLTLVKDLIEIKEKADEKRKKMTTIEDQG